MKLHLGCGRDIWVGYINIDKRYYPGVDIVCDFFDIPDDITNASEIRAHHVLEHIPFSKSLAFINICRERLAVGGKIVIEVPDFEWCVANWMAQMEDDVWSETSENKIGRWNYSLMTIFGSQTCEEQYHRTGFTERRLKSLLMAAEFTEIVIERVWHYEQMSLVASALVR